MLKIRLRQQGKKNSRTFRLVVTDSRSKRDGKYKELLGRYNPQNDGDMNLFINEERVNYWIKKGAQFTEKAKALVERK